MSEKKFKGAPFGTQSHRFDVSGVHPANKRVGTYTQISYCRRRTCNPERKLGPGTYNIDIGDFSARAVRERSKGPDWKRALETTRLAQIPHLLYRDAWANKQFLKTKVGPGTYKISSFIEELQKKPGSLRGICESREERFKDSQSTSVGPGIYKITSFIEEMEKKPGSPRGICETREQRFKDYQSCTPGPGTYDKTGTPSTTLEDKERRNGRNSMDCNARLKRFPENIVKRTDLGPGKYTKEVLEFGEELQRPEKKKHGMFSTLEQYPSVPTERIYLSTLPQCPRPMTFPGPGWYDVTPLTQSRSGTPAPFLSSAPRFSRRMRMLLNKSHNTVGPGRYDVANRNVSANGHRSAFISETQRYPHCPARDKYNQERLRPLNVPLEKRSSLV